MAGFTLVALVAAVFGRVGGHAFVCWDDDEYVYLNPHVLGGLSLKGARWALTAFEAANWHPLTWLSHMADVSIFGLEPGAHHLVNVAFHAANAVLLYLALWKMTREALPSTFVAALFAVHPLHVESVAWVAERKDVLSTFFGMLALWAHAAYVERRVASRYAAVVGAFVLSLAAKPMLVTLPFVLLLLDVWPLRRLAPFRSSEPGAAAERPSRVVLEKVPLLALSVASSVVTYLAQRGSEAVVSGVSLGDRVAHALAGYGWCLGKTLWPASLAFFYPTTGGASLRWRAAAAAAVLAALTYAAVTQRERRPWLAVGWLWFLGTLVPVIGLVRVGAHSVADRYAYFPLIGVFVGVTWLAAEAASRFRRARVPLVLTGLSVVAALSAASWIQVGFWREGETLFARALQVTTGNWVAYNQLGRDRLERDPAGAAALFSQALEIEPGAFFVWANLGLAQRRLGNTNGELAAFRRASELRPTDARARFDLGYALIASGRLDEAVAEYERGLALQPGSAAAHYNLGYALQRLGRSDGARAAFATACRLAPDDPRLCGPARPP